MSPKDKTSVSLVLGSGGARGLAHIGVIEVIEEKGLEIGSISGSSIGALIGGIYAAGKLEEYESWVRGLSKFEIVNMMDIAWDGGGLVKGDKIIRKMVDLVGDRQIEDLPIRFTAVATELETGREIWISKGSLFDAIRSSISLPLFFTPVKRRKNLLIDGGVVNPVPIAPTFDDETDLTIAVNLGGKPENDGEAEADDTDDTRRETADEGADPGFFRKLRLRLRGLLSLGPAGGDIGAYDVAYQAFDAMQSTIARQKLAAYPPDLVIEIPRDACGTLEFHRAAEMIDLGRKLAEEKLS